MCECSTSKDDENLNNILNRDELSSVDMLDAYLENTEHNSQPNRKTGLSVSNRRNFILGGVGLMSSIFLADFPAFANGNSLALNIRNQRTGESLKVAWIRNGQVDQRAVTALHLLTRDWREKKAAKMDVKLYVILSYIQHSVGLDKQIILTSGYRTLETNNTLLSSGASPRSFHMRGQALDFTVSGADMFKVSALAKRLKLGGVGYYPNNNFVHVDTGPIRQWES